MYIEGGEDRVMVTPEEMKSIQLEMMDSIHEFCERRNLRYYLAYGTLLGAIRHKGFIPWDDDIDIVMPRNDYEEFLASFGKQTGMHYSVLHVGCDEGYSYPFAKCVDTRTVLVENADYSEPIGVYIDIFPLDNLSDNYSEAKSFFKSVGRARNKLTIKRVSVRKGRSWYKNLVLRIGKLILHWKSVHELACEINDAAKRYSGRDIAGYVCVVVLGTYGTSEILNGEWFSNWVPAAFEDRTYHVPIGWNEVLSCLYADYMTLPAEKDRATHHSYIAYWKA